MKFAVIGAGEGSRLRDEGVLVPKPLVKIRGVPLIERILAIASRHGATSLHLIVNSAFPEVKTYLESRDFGVPLDCRLLSTPSSMHTLFALAAKLRGEPFCLTTVDTMFREVEFQSFVEFAASSGGVDGVLAITGYVCDEKPLCVELDKNRTILGFQDAKGNLEWATGGIYYFSPRIFDAADEALAAGIMRLRNFLRLLLRRGYLLKGFPFSKIIDVDHASDIEDAERFLQEDD
jgi:NDP-sugar pyrophosphorylase family protein